MVDGECMPLVIRAPGVTEPRQSHDEPVSVLDLYPMLIAYPSWISNLDNRSYVDSAYRPSIFPATHTRTVARPRTVDGRVPV